MKLRRYGKYVAAVCLIINANTLRYICVRDPVVLRKHFIRAKQ